MRQGDIVLSSMSQLGLNVARSAKIELVRQVDQLVSAIYRLEKARDSPTISATYIELVKLVKKSTSSLARTSRLLD